MKERNCILTYDIGTTGNKCSVFDITGNMLASTTIHYATEYPFPGWSQQNPEDYWDSVIKGTKCLFEKAPEIFGRIACISLSGHMNGMLPIDQEGKALFPEVIHSDNRAEPFCNDIRNKISDSDFYSICGNRIDVHLSLPKILWFKSNHPDLYKKTSYFIQSKDFIAGNLTGNYGITDFSDASLTCVLDLTQKAWSKEILEINSLSIEKFPHLLHSHDQAGTLGKDQAVMLHLPRGLPVFMGGGDAASSARGAGIDGYKMAQNNIGSSSWISLLSPAPLMDEKRRIQNFFDLDGVNFNLCGTVQSAGIAIDWLLEEMIQPGNTKVNKYSYCESLAQTSKAGSNGLFFIPYLMGERTPHWNSSLKGAFLGLSLNHKKKDICRSVFEGITLALKDVLDVFNENDKEIEKLSLTGGGAISLFWNQIMSDVYQKPVNIPHAPKQATSLGAAMAAGVGMNFYKSYSEAVKLVHTERTVNPGVENMEIYEERHSMFKRLYASYADLSALLSSY
ncbi:xylulokinase [Oceanispirochaeta crateris]|uniref:Xylulokinase n=1 Tax=Oceanispirochaeta crateris TaxID=2518645 RepID=A0A5C1QP38_9SPIO|nr:FGGY family carbohydrate kinase [Oceanispirochaeta crateris]QEN09733.1 xylulokinase [Oceanispirochaeta crateris]